MPPRIARGPAAAGPRRRPARTTRRHVGAARRHANTARRAVAPGALRVALKRAYEPPARSDGPRVLVDRVWPRGVTKETIRIAAWLRDLGPTTRLRQWFGHDPVRWEGFRERYRRELTAKTALLRELAGYARNGQLTLVYGAHDPNHNQAVVIKELLGRRRS